MPCFGLLLFLAGVETSEFRVGIHLDGRDRALVLWSQETCQ